mgnify:CR=1 FL=1
MIKAENDRIMLTGYDLEMGIITSVAGRVEQTGSIIINAKILCDILRNVPEQNKKYVKKQLDLLDDNYLDYIFYWDEKYYRNGFVDGVKMVMGCVEE